VKEIPWSGEAMKGIAAVDLCDGSWFGHPEQPVVEKLYQLAAEEVKRQVGDIVGFDWMSPLVCWQLLDKDGNGLARAYNPTEATPRWVFTDWRGNMEIDRPIEHDRLMTLIVSYCLREGRYVDTLYL
jgi:hypothetical protein